jgi:hexosaminidase
LNRSRRRFHFHLSLLKNLNLLPAPRSLILRPGSFVLPRRATLHLDAALKPDEARAIARRLQFAVKLIWEGRHVAVPKSGSPTRQPSRQTIRAIRTSRRNVPPHPEGYVLTISRSGIEVLFRETGGLRAAVATLRQLPRENGRRLPCLIIRDWPDFPRRGVMLDISRGRVPKLATLLDLAEHLADFKINELQLYTEHTFAYRQYQPVWRGWGALTAAEIRTLDTRCRELGIDLVPNQNSFGHLREFLAQPKLKRLAEVSAPYESDTGDFVRYPTTLFPNHPSTLPFLRDLYDELLPNFSSRFFNVGCDETWDLGRGRSKKLCTRLGKGRVYLDFLKTIHREVSARGRTMMFWGDIILKYPELIPELARWSSRFSVSPNKLKLELQRNRAGSETGVPNLVALNWGYEADHPFEKEAASFAKSKIPFYVCPGTSTWMTLIGRHDNAFANLRAAARAGRKHGASGYLITDWGDGGHPQPLAVSWLPYLYGASLAWNARSCDEKRLIPVLSRDVFCDPARPVAKAARALGHAHLKFGYRETNQTPFGTVIAAPKFGSREMICRDGPKCYARIPARNIRAALAEVEKQIRALKGMRPRHDDAIEGRILVRELELAARMAAESCHIMLWQQTLAAEDNPKARRRAGEGIRRLKILEREFKAFWPQRNKGSTRHGSPWLRWRIEDYRRGRLHFLPEQARERHPKLFPAE